MVRRYADDALPLALSSRCGLEICEYPDSGKIAASSNAGLQRLHKMFQAEGAVGYYDREKADGPLP